MNRIRQHIPAFVDGVEPATAEFATRQDLEALPFVANWLRDGYRLETSRNLLMAVGPKDHWVLGYLDEPLPQLPVWRAP